jgi:hypothetical protein
MKVQIKDLEPNPYRDIKNYPMDQIKIETLKNSIEQTGFWDNILARKINGHIQIAYGHHRLEALKLVKKPTDYIDIPIKDLDDATMIQIMANENMEQWETNQYVINESVKVAKDFLDGELKKCKTLLEVKKSYLINLLDTNMQEDNYQSLKSKGVGQTTILKFLGSNWKQWQVQEALDNLKSEDIDRQATEVFATPSHAIAFDRRYYY